MAGECAWLTATTRRACTRYVPLCVRWCWVISVLGMLSAEPLDSFTHPRPPVISTCHVLARIHPHRCHGAANKFSEPPIIRTRLFVMFRKVEYTIVCHTMQEFQEIFQFKTGVEPARQLIKLRRPDGSSYVFDFKVSNLIMEEYVKTTQGCVCVYVVCS